MSVMDEFETGPAEGLQPIAMRDPLALQLTPQDLVILASWVASPAYRVCCEYRHLADGRRADCGTDQRRGVVWTRQRRG